MINLIAAQTMIILINIWNFFYYNGNWNAFLQQNVMVNDQLSVVYSENQNKKSQGHLA